MADSLADVLKQKPRDTSIESNSRVSANASIELPAEIAELNTGSDYWRLAKGNRYRKLIREGHLRDLLELAAIAKTKGKKAEWFASVCSVAKWERTLHFLSEMRRVAEAAAQVAKRLMVAPANMKAVYKACWKLKEKAIYNAEKAVETARGDRFKYFCWLTWPPAKASA